MKRLSFILAASAAALIGGCGGERIEAPTGRGLCWYIADQADGSIRNNKVAENIPNIEQCAAELERMRIRFIRMGGTNHEILGAYQGTFIMLRREGIFTAQRLGGMQYMLLQRANGKLVMPGAIIEAEPQTPVDASAE